MINVIILAKTAEQLRIENYGNSVADGVEANPTDFPDANPTPANVKLSIKTYVDSIKTERNRSIATDEATETKRMTAIGMVNQLITYAYYAVDGNVEKLSGANIELRKAATRKEITKLEVETSRMGPEPGSYFFRLKGKAGSSTIGVFRKDADGEFRLVDAFDVSIFLLKGQPSGSQTYLFKGKKGNNHWDSASTSNAITVNVP